MSAIAVPLIGVSACRQQVGKNSSHTVGDKYVEAAGFAGMPLILPARDGGSDTQALLARLDGILLPVRLQMSSRIITMARPARKAPGTILHVTA